MRLLLCAALAALCSPSLAAMCATDGTLSLVCGNTHALDPILVVNAGGSTVATLEAPSTFSPLDGFDFGRSAAISGRVAAVGSPNIYYEGSAFVYDSHTGERLLDLKASPGFGTHDIPDIFGDAVDTDGVLVAVSAPGSNGGANYGHVLVYDLAGVELQRFTTFGVNAESVELDGTSVLVSGFDRMGDPVTLRFGIVPEPGAVGLVLSALVALFRPRQQKGPPGTREAPAAEGTLRPHSTAGPWWGNWRPVSPPPPPATP